jgi:hypothetical protein
MCLRSSSVPKFLTLISTNWPQLRSTAWRHIFSRSYGNPKRPSVTGFRMWTARHIDGSLQRLCHGEHTICALVRISNASSLIRIDAVTSRGRASQLGNSSAGSGEGSIARHGKRSPDMSDFEEERKKIREVRFQSENMKSQA